MKRNRMSNERFIFLISAILGGMILVLQIDPIYPMLNRCNTSSYDGELTENGSSNKRAYVPLDIVVVNTESRVVEYTEADIQTILADANKVWRPANVTFTISSFRYDRVPDEALHNLSSLDDDRLRRFAGSVLGSKLDDRTIDVIFVDSFANGKSGRALVSGNLAVAFMSHLDNMDQASLGLAHELGHALGLCDVFEINLMMKVETNLRMALRDAYQPANLTAEQVRIVHNTIEIKYPDAKLEKELAA